MTPTTKQNLKIASAVIITALVVYFLFRKKAPVIEFVDSPIKTMMNYNIPPVGDFIYNPKDFSIPCGCKSKTTPAKESSKVETNLSQYVANMDGFVS